MRALMSRLAIPVLLSIALTGCGDDPTGPTIVEGEFRGTYIDVSTCIDPGSGSWPMTIWLYEHSPQTQGIKVALSWGHGGSASNADEQFAGTLEPNWRLHAFAVDRSGDVDEEYEIEATLIGDRLTGRFYEHCGDGTADIWEFDLTRVD